MQKIIVLVRQILLVSLACTLALSNSVFADMSYSYRSLQDMLWVDDECSTTSGVSGSAPSGTLDNDPDSGYGTTPGVNKHLFIIVHTTEGDSLGAATEALKSKGYSYHTLIEKDGKETRLISDDANAKGAGGANTNSLQVSLVGMVGADQGSHFDPQSPQLQTLSKRIGEWASKYKIPLEKVAFTGQDNTHGVLGHIDVSAVSAASQGHTDPGKNFPWAQVLANAKAGAGDTSSLSNVSSSSGGSSGGDACCPSSGSAASATTGDGGGCGIPENDKQENKDQVWSFFNKKFQEAGYSSEEAEKATAGIMGNWQQESAFNPARSDGMGCTEYAAFGIAQWCGKGNGDRHGDRILKLEEYAKSVGQKPTCLGAQLEFAWKEMGDKKLVEGMKGKDPKEAAHIFNLGGNGASGFEVGADDGKRQSNAAEQYTKYTGKSPTSLGERGSSGCSSSSSVNGGPIADVATQMGEWGATGDACYETGGGHGTTQDLQERIDHKFAKGYGVDCSGFTRAVIYKSTGKDPGGLSTSAMCASDLYEKVPRSQAKPGDLAIDCPNHVEVITAVNSDGSFKTVGSHSSGCGPGKGPSPANYQGTEDFVLRFKGGSTSVDL